MEPDEYGDEQPFGLLSSKDFMDLPPVKRLVYVREVIELFPQHHDQAHFTQYSYCNRYGVSVSSGLCKTTFCIAGWACFLAGETEWDKSPESYDHETRATEILGLTPEEAGILFFTTDNAPALELLDEYIRGYSK